MMLERRRLLVSRWLFIALCVVVMANAVITPVLWTKIQHSRQDSIRTQCEELNMRHDRTIRTLNALIAKSIRTAPERAVRARQGRESTVALIEALAPKRDCAALVDRLIR